MSPSKLIHSGLVALALLCAAGCASSSRMMRFLPDAGGEPSPGAQGSVSGTEERVNAWPLAYSDKGRFSALWPMVDADSRGMAVRPFFNKEDSDCSVLFPLSAWNPENRDGWCLLYYWGPERWGAFPLANFEKDGSSFIMPIFWNAQEGRYGSPVCYFSKGFNFAGPVFWDNEQGYVSSPFLFYSSDSFNHIGPLLWDKERGYASLPLLFYASKGFCHAGPVFWNSQEGYYGSPAFYFSKGFNFAGPFCWNKAAGYYASPVCYLSDGFNIAGPVFWNSAKGYYGSPLCYFSKGFNFAGPVFWDREKGYCASPVSYSSDGFNIAGPVFWDSAKGYYGSPLCYFSKGFNFAGPVFWNNGGESEEQASYGLFPAFLAHRGLYATGPFWYRQDGPEGPRGGLFPLFKESAKEGGFLPLYKHSSDSESGERLFSILMGALARVKSEGDGSSSNYVFPLYWSSKDGRDLFIYPPFGMRLSDAKTGERRSWIFNWYSAHDSVGDSQALLPFFFQSSDERETLLVTPLGGGKLRKGADGDELAMLNVLGPLYTSSDDGEHEMSSALFPLSYFESSKNGAESLNFVFPWFQKRDGGNFKDGVLPLYVYDSAGKLVLPALLSSYSWKGGNESLDVLLPFFHKDPKGFRLAPLVSWNDSFPSLVSRDGGSFSVLGAFGYKREVSTSRSERSEIEARALAVEGLDAAPARSVKSSALLLCSSLSASDGFELLSSRNEIRRSELAICPFFFKESHTDRSCGLPSEEREELQSAFRRLQGRDPESCRREYDVKKAESLAASGKESLEAILERHGLRKGSSAEELAAGLAALDAKTATESSSASLRIPLVYIDETKDGRNEGDVLWFLSRWSSEGGKGRFSILEYMYRHEYEGALSRYDMLPFVSVDSSPDGGRFSFLWRVFSCKTDKDGAELHILFIPVKL